MVLMMVSLVISGCVAPPLLNDQLLQDTSLVEGNPCEAPCWQGITPGETTWDDAITIIEGLSSVEEVRMAEGGREDAGRLATFMPADGTTCCEVYSEDGETVSRLLLRVAPEMTLGQLVEQYGEPTYVYADPYANEEAVGTLIYTEIPMVIAFHLDGVETGVVDEESQVIGVFLSLPDAVDSVVSVSRLYEWDGFQQYAAYAENPPDLIPTPPGEAGE